MTDQEIIEYIKSKENQVRLMGDHDRFQVYNGKLKEVIKKAISTEFARPETISELVNRIIPINITQKIINKLSMVYMSAPRREALDQNPMDNELIDLYSGPLKINMNGKIANRYYKLFKHAVWEPYLDSDGVPRIRTLPSHTYTPISTDPREPHKPTIFVKHLYNHKDPLVERFAIWTNETFKIVNGNGDYCYEEMQKLDNPEGVNPFGVIPVVYISEPDDLCLIPISDDDLICMQVAICLLLTDLAFASKYQLWSIFVLTGADGSAKLELNPNSIIQLPEGADFKTVKPDTDIDKALNYIESLISLLLTTKNLSVGDISGSVKAEGASGVAKMIDRAETTEDRKDQQAIFIDAEKQLWELFSHKMLPHWVQTGQINPDYVGKFSEDFEVAIKFPDPKPYIGDAEIVDVEKAKLDAGLTTKMMALKAVHPDLEGEQIIALVEELHKEEKERIQLAERSLSGDQVDAQSI